MNYESPTWVKDAVFYQIFPDRFARSPRTRHPQGILLKPWGSPPEEQGFQGGDLHGIVDHLDYLQELGINALYLNPVFASASNHRYHTYDYTQVDPLLGGNEALRELVDEAHRRSMRVVLDGVFNHASRGFWAFHHILETGPESPYLNWFTVHGWPLRPYNSDAQHPANYEAWLQLPALPKFNHRHPAVRAYLLDIARRWIDFGVDGWRLDVPNEIDDDAFWREFRQAAKSANPEAYICGEIWGPAQRWLQGDQFDAVMNYIFTWAALSYCGARTIRTGYYHDNLDLTPRDAAGFGEVLDWMFGLYSPPVNHAQLNLLDSHDMARALWIMGGDVSALRLCVFLQMTLPGAPCIYYGDEIGMQSGGDPYCRAAFPWDEPKTWDHDLLAYYRQAITLRHRWPILRSGSWQKLLAVSHVYGFQRRLGEQQAIVLVNAGSRPATVDVPCPGPCPLAFNQVWPQDDPQSYLAEDGRLLVVVPARQGVVLVSE